jgi:predicted TPR repeat methyltransferase
MASSIIFSFGDVVVDRRFEWARESLAAGDFQAAADLLEQTIELAPAYAPAWFALGEARERLGQRDGAIAVRASLDAAGLELVSLDSASTRTEKGLPVPSLIVVARSPAS